MSTGAQRVLALVVAAGLVVAALVLRGALDDSSEAGDDRPLELLCAAELDDVCRAIDESDDVTVVVEEQGAAMRRLAGLPDGDRATAGIDGWLAVGPAAAGVDVQRPPEDALFGPTGEPLARSPLVLVAWEDRAGVLAARCGDVDWRCVGDVAPEQWSAVGGSASWGRVKPSHHDPAATGAGWLAIAQILTSYYGRTDVASNDFELDNDFLGWFQDLEHAIPSGSGESPLFDMLAKGPSAVDVVGTTEAEAGPQIAVASRRSRLAPMIYPQPVTTADVVFAPLAASRRAGDLEQRLRSTDVAAALADDGWRVAGVTPVTGVGGGPELPATANLPSAGTMVTLLGLWGEVA